MLHLCTADSSLGILGFWGKVKTEKEEALAERRGQKRGKGRRRESMKISRLPI
jgi:hypothetical protein